MWMLLILGLLAQTEREAIEKELARLDAPEAADEAKARPLFFDVGSRLGAYKYDALVPLLLAAVEKAASPKRKFLLEAVRGRMAMRGEVTEAKLAEQNAAIVETVMKAADDPDYWVRCWVGEILQDLADGDVLPGEPPKTVPPGEKLKGALKAAFAKLAGDRNPRVRASAELGASWLEADPVERLRLRAEVDHYLDHCPRRETAFEDLPPEEGKKLRAGVQAKAEREGGVLVVTIACAHGKGEEKPDQLTLFYRLDDGEWIECLKDPRKKKR